MIGSAKAAVFPEPVFAPPVTFRPARMARDTSSLDSVGLRIWIDFQVLYEPIGDADVRELCSFGCNGVLLVAAFLLCCRHSAY